MIRNKHINKIQEINPLDDRLMTITMKGKLPHTFINPYMYTAENCDKNEKRYELMTAEFDKHKNKGPTYTGGT